MADIPTYEIASGNRLSVNWQAIGQTTRAFVVETLNPAVAATADALPQRNSQHPTLPGYRVDTIDIAPNEQGFCDVAVIYTNNRGGAPRTVNKDDPTWYLWGWESQVLLFEVPVNKRVTITVPAGEAGDIEKRVWALETIKLEQTLVVRPLTLRLFDFPNVVALDAIARQTDRVHTMPDGRSYRFRGGDVNQIDATTYEVRYAWVYDPGTRMPAIEGQSDAALFIAPENADPGFLRNPYSQVVGKPSADPANMPHESLLVFPYTVDPDGWRELPGVPRVL